MVTVQTWLESRRCEPTIEESVRRWIARDRILRTKDPCRRVLTFDALIATEIETTAQRLDRTTSWVLQRAWQIAREQIRSSPTTTKERR